MNSFNDLLLVHHELDGLFSETQRALVRRELEASH